MPRETSENPQKKPDLHTIQKKADETKGDMRERAGKSQEEPEKTERPDGPQWQNRQKHAEKVSKVLGEQTGTVEPKTVKEKSENTDSNKGGGGLPPGGDQGKRGGDSGSPRLSMAPLPLEKKSAEPTEQKTREEPQGTDHQRTTAQASRMVRGRVLQGQDRPSTTPDQGTDNTPRR